MPKLEERLAWTGKCRNSDWLQAVSEVLRGGPRSAGAPQCCWSHRRWPPGSALSRPSTTGMPVSHWPAERGYKRPH
eukprot:scaffold64904_cov35-Prasinocladus_malaysianus.AAC.1